MRNLHVPLPDALYDALKGESKRQNTPSTVLARDAIQTWLRRQEQARIQEEISSYAVAVAGTEDDLDEALMATGLEHLENAWSEDGWSKESA